MRVALIVTTYNSGTYIQQLLESLNHQNKEVHVIFADDGSTDDTLEKLNAFRENYSMATILALPHGERGIARAKALEVAFKMSLKYLMFIDADMILERQLIPECIKQMENEPLIGALVIKENPISTYTNLMTKVKLFERTVVNNSRETLDPNSIEAARFWKLKEFLESGGINPKQISFEETQPTIRYIEFGGLIKKHIGKGLSHDEKEVTLSNILGKKKYHFEMMNTTFETEDKGLLKAFKRWYFFRPVMYRKVNLKLYLQHPILTIGMIAMYFMLTGIGCAEIVKHKIAV